MVDNDASAETLPSPKTLRHKSLYLTGEPVIIRVEETLFRVHRHFLTRHSKVFADLFKLPPVAGKPGEGLTDEHPIILEGVTCRDFERLLSLFYPENIRVGDLSTTEEWTSVLALATKWDFAEYRQLAIARLAQLASPVDRILLGRRYDVPEWLTAAYLELCTRDDVLSYDEGMLLGMHDVILLSDIRQNVRKGRITMQQGSLTILIEQRLGGRGRG
ncbi:hypothetical protein C8Q72DRAFT_887192 [Fomitopsis betulina]|nr:hypothetical protein C8Q72DRAFT_887192 [Fomitopsis betulina]